MTTYSTYIDGTYGKPETKVMHPELLYVLSRKINFASQSLDAGNADVLKALQIPAKTRVLDAWIEVKTACASNATVDLGDGTDVDLFGNGLPLDATGRAIPVLAGSTTWDAGSLESGDTEAKEITVDGASLGDNVVVAHGVDIADLIVNAQVTAANTVTVTLTAAEDTVIEGSATWDAGSLEGGETASKDITVTGAALGDLVDVSFGVDVSDLAVSAQVTTADTVTVTLSNVNDTIIEGSTTWDAASIAAGAEEAKDVTVTGAALGDYAIASFSLDVTDLVLDAQVTATNTVTCVLANNTGGAIDLGSGTIKARVIQPATAVDLASTTVKARVTSQGTAIDLASATIGVNVLKSKGSLNQGKYYSSADTIDLKATTDTADVDISSGVVLVKALCVDENLK